MTLSRRQIPSGRTGEGSRTVDEKTERGREGEGKGRKCHRAGPATHAATGGLGACPGRYDSRLVIPRGLAGSEMGFRGVVI